MVGTGEPQLRGFQREVLALAREQNVVLVGSTGIGKTFVALALLAEQDYAGGRRAVVMAPTRQLVAQLATKVRLLSSLSCRAFFGRELDLWDERRWAHELRATRVLVCTPEVARSIVEKGYVPLACINLLVFDECHHVTKRHPYAQIAKMLDLKDPARMPRVFGTTACPTKGCAEALFATLKNVELDARELARYAATAPLLYEVYPKTRYGDTRGTLGTPYQNDDGTSNGAMAGGESESIEAALRGNMEAEEAQLCTMLWEELTEVKVLQVCAKLLQKGRSSSGHSDAGREKLLHKFVRNCYAVYKNLGAWCYYRFAELEVERLAMAASLLLAVPGSMFGLDPDAVETLLLLRAKRSKCDFAATAKVLKIEELVWSKLLTAAEVESDACGASQLMKNSQNSHSDHDDNDSVTPARAAAFMASAIATDDSTDDSVSDVSSEPGTMTSQRPSNASQLQGIVHVNTRIECRVLCEYLNEKLAHLAEQEDALSADDDDDKESGSHHHLGETAAPVFSCMLGQGSMSDTAAFNLPTFQKTLDDFESGVTRVMISTSVSVEGVDFPLCGLVIIADRVNNARMLIQLCGRARHEDGVVYYLAEENDADDHVRFKQLLMEADAIKGLEFSCDKDQSILALPRSVTADMLIGHPFSPDQTKLVVEATGAKLDLDSSVACINQFCQSLPANLYTLNVKTMYSYTESTHGKTPIFKAMLQLPPELDLGMFESDFTLSKSMAKASVAFVAARTLWEKGHLDNSFNSVYRRAKSKAAQSNRNLDFFLNRIS